MVKFALPSSLDDPPDAPRHEFWAPPGGGAEHGEAPHDTLRRELHEEVGFRLGDLGPEVWTRTALVPFLNGRHDGQLDRYFLVRCPAFEPEPAIGWTQLRAEYVVDMRWWTLPEIGASSARFAPSRMASVLAELLASGPPPTPTDVGW